MVDAQLSTRLKDFIEKTFRSFTAESEKKAQEERKRYIDLVEKSVKDIIKDEVKMSLTKFELKKILLDKMQKSKLYRGAQKHKDLYDGLVKSYKLDKDLFESYGKAYSIKRDHKDKYKDEDPPVGSDQGLKTKKTSKDIEPSKGSKSKESNDLGNTDNQPNVEAVLELDWFKKPKRPPTPDSDWNATKSIDFRPPQTWISRISQAEKPLLTFVELMSTPIDFLVFVMNNLKIDNLTQKHLVGLAFNLLKGTCRSQVEIEYHFEECYKAVTDRLNWNNPEGQEYTFDLSKSLPYRRHGSIIMESIEVTHVKVMKWYDYGYLEEIVVRRKDQKLYKFKEGDFPRLNIRDIKDMLLLLVQKEITNLKKYVIFDLNVALWMFTRRVVILKRVEDVQLGVKSYQKKLNITRLETFRFGIYKRTPYTAYNSPQGIIYVDKFKRNRLMCWDELYKFSNGTLTSVRSVLHDIASNLRMDYLPTRR
uniref:Uncharacterized protein n=1 Tax=Tanacetum cinerariifolium TaxID=118510 RepID=A0A6L2P3N7_TANCI|nr:hypothetical protein [Tanacetum cinerariifolium]